MKKEIIMSYNTTIKKLQLKSLMEFPDNPQVVSEDKMILMVNDMRKFGWYGELSTIAILDKKFYVISGNHRVQAAIRAGILDQDCIVIDDSNYNWLQAKKDCVKFNTIHGDPDDQLLGKFINNITDEFDINIDEIVDDLGMNQDEMNKLFQNKDAKDLSNKLKSEFEIIIECENENEMEERYNRLRKLGYKCRLLTF